MRKNILFLIARFNNGVLSLAIILSAFNFNNLALIASQPAPVFNTLIDATSLISSDQYRFAKVMPVKITAYSSTPDQTDDTPFITASNSHVRDGVAAANFLSFGTKIMIPELFGAKIFTIEDRMHRRFSDRVDIWFPDRAMALRFGLRQASIIVLQ